jgi:hypothetical protein
MDRENENRQPSPSDEPRVFKVASTGGRRAFLQTLSKGAVIGGAAVVADDCGDKTTAPTPVAATSTTTTTSTTSTTSTTTSVPPTSTLAGVVSDETTGRPIGGGRVMVVDGPGAGRSSSTDGNGYYSIPGIAVSSFTARATATGYNLQDKGLTLARDTRLDFTLRPLVTTTTTAPTTTSVPRTTTTISGCSCNPVCTCNPLTYFYPN